MPGRSKDIRSGDIKEVFTLHDKDRENRVPTAMLGMCLRCLPLNPTNADVDKIAQQVLGGKQYFGMSELEKCVQMASAKSYNSEDLKDAFKVFDRDASGLINAAEIRHVLTSLGERLSDKELDDMFQCIEVDPEGNISVDDITPKMVAEPSRR